MERKLERMHGDLHQVKNALFTLLIRSRKIMADLSRLTQEVAESRGAVQSAITLIRGLRQQIIDAGTDPAKLEELANSLDQDQRDLAEAVAENDGGSTGGVGGGSTGGV